MERMDRLTQELWDRLHNELKSALQKEVYLTRELLSNMHLEEISLKAEDQYSLNGVLKERAVIVEQLFHLRACREEVKGKLEDILHPGKIHASIDQLLPPTEEVSAEILGLSEQLRALMERMNIQQTYNQRLEMAPRHRGSFSRAPVRASVPTRRKAIVATYPEKY